METERKGSGNVTFDVSFPFFASSLLCCCYNITSSEALKDPHSGFQFDSNISKKRSRSFVYGRGSELLSANSKVGKTASMNGVEGGQGERPQTRPYCIQGSENWDPHSDGAKILTLATFVASARTLWFWIPSGWFLTVLIATSTPSKAATARWLGRRSRWWRD